MKRIELQYALVILCLIVISFNGFSQEDGNNKRYINSIVDSLARRGIITEYKSDKPNIKFTESQAMKYLKLKYNSTDWNSQDDPLRGAIAELLYFATHQPFDSLKKYLNSYSYDSIDMPWVHFYKWDSLRMKIPVIVPAGFSQPSDSVQRWDTLTVPVTRDSAGVLITMRQPDSLYAYRKVKRSPGVIMKDTVFMVATNVYPEVPRYSSRQPFRVYRYPYQSDSISVALKMLTEYITAGDSSRINVRGLSGSVIPVWLNSSSEKMEHYWLRNEFNDSVIVWIGTTGRDTLGLFLEEGITFKRPVKQTNISNARLTLKQINSGALQSVDKMYIKPRMWKLHSETNFILNQTYLTNWASGGQSSVSTTLDVTGFADYKNAKLKITSTNFLRIKYGLIKPGQEDIRKSTDLLETNSKINHKAFGKFDFSAILLFKTQISTGYDYPNDSVRIPVSTFMNPAKLIFGLGLDYKPEKKTSINFAPLSYKATIVLDTVKYSGKKYGIPQGKRVLQEPGVSLQITNEYSPYKNITLINRVQFFTNYIDHPQNIDIDWELIATFKLNWFTEVRFNTHMIYDDNTLIPLVNKHGKPIIGSDGVQETGKRLQFKEILGFSFVFRY